MGAGTTRLARGVGYPERRRLDKVSRDSQTRWTLIRPVFSSFASLSVNYFVGIDVGGTTSTVAIGDKQRRIRYLSDQFETRSADGPAPLVEAVVDAVRQGVESLGARPTN